MAILSLSNAHLAYGHVALLDGTTFALEPGERLGLIGRNGAGKSSLLKVLAGLEKLDDGLLQMTQGLRICYVPQEPEFDAAQSVFDAVSLGVAEARAVRQRYEEHAAGTDLDALQTRIETLDAWNWEQRVDTTLAQLQLDGARVIGGLSGGMKKRVALAQALVAVPDVLLLDEPTNHLDLGSMAWLERLLVGNVPPRPPLHGVLPREGEQGSSGRPSASFKGSVILITHDRAFLDGVVTRIVELDRGLLRSYPGNFSAYEKLKEDQLAADALANARADKLLAAEELWVRKGVEARRTRSVARIERLQALRARRQARRDTLGQVRLEIDAGVPSGKIVAELRRVSMRFGPQVVVDDFSATLLRGDKVGLIGPNGAGKTTLLKLILGELQPSSGTVRHGSRLEVAYFDQMRSRLDLDATLADSISPGSEWVEFNGQRKHVMSYLNDFLFAPERANSPVRTLSGGERNRVLLARLFALPANVLVLDEPTNDLDIDTLELLEELLQSYGGTVFLVSHDRRFLDNVVTSTIAWEGPQADDIRRPPPEGDEQSGKATFARESPQADDIRRPPPEGDEQSGKATFAHEGNESAGRWREYEGGYEDWVLQRERARQMKQEAAQAAAPRRSAAPAAAAVAPKARASSDKGSTKLSFKEQRELQALPALIDALEAEHKSIAGRLASSMLYTEAPQQVAELRTRYAAIENELPRALQRWEALASR